MAVYCTRERKIEKETQIERRQRENVNRKKRMNRLTVPVRAAGVVDDSIVALLCPCIRLCVLDGERIRGLHLE